MIWLLLLLTMLLIPTAIALRVWWEHQATRPEQGAEGVPMEATALEQA